jgi:hypothetical protein
MNKYNKRNKYDKDGDIIMRDRRKRKQNNKNIANKYDDNGDIIMKDKIKRRIRLKHKNILNYIKYKRHTIKTYYFIYYKQSKNKGFNIDYNRFNKICKKNKKIYKRFNKICKKNKKNCKRFNKIYKNKYVTIFIYR